MPGYPWTHWRTSEQLNAQGKEWRVRKGFDLIPMHTGVRYHSPRRAHWPQARAGEGENNRKGWIGSVESSITPVTFQFCPLALGVRPCVPGGEPTACRCTPQEGSESPSWRQLSQAACAGASCQPRIGRAWPHVVPLLVYQSVGYSSWIALSTHFCRFSKTAEIIGNYNLVSAMIKTITEV